MHGRLSTSGASLAAGTSRCRRSIAGARKHTLLPRVGRLRTHAHAEKRVAVPGGIEPTAGTRVHQIDLAVSHRMTNLSSRQLATRTGTIRSV